MNPEEYTEDNFIDRVVETGVEVRTPDGTKVVALMDSVFGMVYTFCDPPYEQVKYGEPMMFDGVHCLRFQLNSSQVVDEAQEWLAIAMFRHVKEIEPEDFINKMVTVNMEIGKKYKIRYRLDGQRRDREMVAILLGLNDTYGPNTMEFSGRPQFGTTSLNPQKMKAPPVEVPLDTECYNNRIVMRHDDED